VLLAQYYVFPWQGARMKSPNARDLWKWLNHQEHHGGRTISSRKIERMGSTISHSDVRVHAERYIGGLCQISPQSTLDDLTPLLDRTNR
jgi:hypothetical protein